MLLARAADSAARRVAVGLLLVTLSPFHLLNARRLLYLAALALRLVLALWQPARVRRMSLAALIAVQILGLAFMATRWADSERAGGRLLEQVPAAPGSRVGVIDAPLKMGGALGELVIRRERSLLNHLSYPCDVARLQSFNDAVVLEDCLADAPNAIRIPLEDLVGVQLVRVRPAGADLLDPDTVHRCPTE